jgi:predicted enzyme related to lactoylglutathione lyase
MFEPRGRIMRRFSTTRIAALTALSLSLFCVQPAAVKEASMPAPIVFFDIAGPDSAKLKDFYSKVFGWEIAANNNVTVPTTGPAPAMLDGTFRQDPPGNLLYFGVTDINAKLEQIKTNGAAAVTPRMPVPGVVILALFTDPAGNRMGLVEMENGKAKIP